MNEYTPTTEEVRNCYAANPPGEHWHPSRHVHRVAFGRWLAEVERAAAAKAEAERDAALSTIAAIEAILPGPRTWAESLSRMPDGSMWPQTVDAEKIRVAIALGSVLSTGRETNERETDGSRGEQPARRGDAERH